MASSKRSDHACYACLRLTFSKFLAAATGEVVKVPLMGPSFLQSSNCVAYSQRKKRGRATLRLRRRRSWRHGSAGQCGRMLMMT